MCNRIVYVSIVTWNVKLHAIVDPLHAVCVSKVYVCNRVVYVSIVIWNVKLHAIVDPLHAVCVSKV